MFLNELKTNRLNLRPFQTHEIELIHSLNQDPDVVRYLGHGKVKTLDESQMSLIKILNDYQNHGSGLLAVLENDSNEFVGRSGLIPWMLDEGLTWEIGYTLKKAAWGKGYATELSSHLARWAQKNLNIPYVISLIHPENQASIHVAEKVGMKPWKLIKINQLRLSAYRLDFNRELRKGS